jgi:hypothetical protein
MDEGKERESKLLGMAYEAAVAGDHVKAHALSEVAKEMRLARVPRAAAKQPDEHQQTTWRKPGDTHPRGRPLDNLTPSEWREERKKARGSNPSSADAHAQRALDLAREGGRAVSQLEWAGKQRVAGKTIDEMISSIDHGALASLPTGYFRIDKDAATAPPRVATKKPSKKAKSMRVADGTSKSVGFSKSSAKPRPTVPFPDDMPGFK